MKKKPQEIATLGLRLIECTYSANIICIDENKFVPVVGTSNQPSLGIHFQTPRNLSQLGVTQINGKVIQIEIHSL